MSLRRSHGDRVTLALLAFGLVALGWLTIPEVPPSAAAPAAQAEPTATPRPSTSPTPTKTVEQELQDLQTRKLDREIRLAEEQRTRIRQQADIDRQIWRAPAEAVASFGPTLVGLGLLYLLARALSHWLPRAQAQPSHIEEADVEEVEEED